MPFLDDFLMKRNRLERESQKSLPCLEGREWALHLGRMDTMEIWTSQDLTSDPQLHHGVAELLNDTICVKGFAQYMVHGLSFSYYLKFEPSIIPSIVDA